MKAILIGLIGLLSNFAIVSAGVDKVSPRLLGIVVIVEMVAILGMIFFWKRPSPTHTSAMR